MNRVAELAWAAGIIEGEGTLHATGRRNVVVAVVMTDEDVLRRLREVLGVGSITGPYLRREGTKPQWHWTVSCARHVAAVVMTLYPLLHERRREQARAVLEVWHTMPGKPGRVYC